MSKDLDFPYITCIPFHILKDKNLSPNIKIYVCVLAAVADEENKIPITSSLAKIFDVSDKCICTWNKQLKENGYLKKQKSRLFLVGGKA